MTAIAEKSTQGEVLSPAELGKRSYETMTGLATNLLATPEFMSALGGAFFGRSGRSGSYERHELEYVYFEKGDFGYLVHWHADPLRFSPKEVRDYSADLRLGIDKYDPHEQDEEDGTKRIASMRLASYFIEDQNGNIKEFKGGRAEIEEDYQPNPPYLNPKAAKTSESATALDRIPELFPDLYPTVVKL